MNNEPEHHDRLVGEVYHGDWAHGPAARFAAEAARHARQVRRRRQVVAGLGGAVLAAAVVFALLRPAPVTPRASPPRAKATVTPPAYEIISDQELLAEVRDRPLLAIREADAQLKVTVLPN